MGICGSYYLLFLTAQKMGISHAKTEGRHRLIRPTLGLCPFQASLFFASLYTCVPNMKDQSVSLRE
jgi:hypothetical protein